MRRHIPLLVKFLGILLIVGTVPSLALLAGGRFLVESVQDDAERKVATTLDLAIHMEEILVSERLGEMGRIAATVAVDRTVVGSTFRTDIRPDLARFAQIYPAADMLLVVNRQAVVLGRSTSDHVGDRFQLDGLIKAAMEGDRPLCFPARVFAAELRYEGQDIRDLVSMTILPTNRSTDPRFGTTLDDGLGLVGVFPIHDPAGLVSGAVVAVDILNRDFSIVDQVASETSKEIPLNATIALDGIRVTTNVKLTDPEGNPTDQRALGTLYADEVRDTLRGGGEYRGRASVVGQWQRTIYRPMYDYKGQVIAGPYVGIPEAYFTSVVNKVKRSIGIVLALVIGGVTVAIITALWWARRRIIRPVRRFEAQIRSRILPEQSKHRNRDEIDDLSDALADLGRDLRSNSEQAATLTTQASERVRALQETLAKSSGETARILATAGDTLRTSQSLQVGAAETNARLRKLSESITSLTEGARRQERSVQFTGKVAAEITTAMTESRERIDRAVEGTGKLTAEARSCLRRVAEFTAGMALLQQGLEQSAGTQSPLELLRDPSDLLGRVATIADRLADDIRLLALTLQENQARLRFIHEEMIRVGTVVEATSESTNRAGTDARAVSDWMVGMVAGAQSIAADLESTYAAAESVATAYDQLVELTDQLQEQTRLLGELVAKPQE